jgi:hypothetical protein
VPSALDSYVGEDDSNLGNKHTCHAGSSTLIFMVFHSSFVFKMTCLAMRKCIHAPLALGKTQLCCSAQLPQTHREQHCVSEPPACCELPTCPFVVQAYV